MATSSHEVDVTSILEAMALEIKGLRSRVGTLENTEIIPGKVKDPSGVTTYGLTSGSTGNLFDGGVHVGGTSAPGDNNLLVDGIITLTGGQLAFPASQNASADANTLDDYEEGTWTPTVIGAGGGICATDTQNGSYTKIGRVVTCNFYVNVTINPGLTGVVNIGGFPFTSASTPNDAVGAAAISYFILTTNWAWVAGTMVANAVRCALGGIKTAEAVTLTDLVTADVGSNAAFIGSITYITAT